MESCSRAERIAHAGPYSRTIAPLTGFEPANLLIRSQAL